MLLDLKKCLGISKMFWDLKKCPGISKNVVGSQKMLLDLARLCNNQSQKHQSL